MRIDLFTLVAQIFNFALLVVFLRLVLYRPIQDAIRRREESVATELEEAQRSRERADEEAERYREQIAGLARERAEALTAAEREAGELAERLKADVREEVERMRSEWHESLRREQEAFLVEVRALVARAVFTVTRNLVRDLADQELEERVVSKFARTLDDLDDADRAAFERAALEAPDGVRARSATRLQDPERAAVSQVLERWLGPTIGITFEDDPRLALGLELLAGDRKIAWSADGYLDGVESEARALVERASS